MLSTSHYISIAITLLLVTLVGIYAARYVRTIKDFTVGGRKIGALLVCGSLVGGFVGGTSTIGTAQMAFHYGFSGIWFTLGAGLSCIFMALFMARPLREKKVETISQYLATVYGNNAAPWVAIYISLGMFIQVGAQVMAAVPLFSAIFGFDMVKSAIAGTAMIVLYVIFGGFWSASLVGLLKLVLIYFSMVIAGLLVLYFFGGFTGFYSALPTEPYFSIFPGGMTRELASVFSVLVGFASTQTYLQPLFAAVNIRAARLGAVAAGLLIPVIGLASVMVGMFMRAQHPDMSPAAALPLFIFEYLPPWLGGIAVASLLISLVLTGAALTLGVATVLGRDIYSRLRPQANDREMLIVSRCIVLLLGIAALVLVTSNVNSLILHWAFLSMALRGVTVFLPLMAAIFLVNKVDALWGRLAVAAAPLCAVTWAIAFPDQVDSLYIGLAISAVLISIGIFIKKKETGDFAKIEK